MTTHTGANAHIHIQGASKRTHTGKQALTLRGKRASASTQATNAADKVKTEAEAKAETQDTHRGKQASASTQGQASDRTHRGQARTHIHRGNKTRPMPK